MAIDKVILFFALVKLPVADGGFGKDACILNWLIVKVSVAILKKSVATKLVLLLLPKVKGLSKLAKVGGV